MIDTKQRDALVDFFRQRVLPLGSSVSQHPRPPGGQPPLPDPGSLYHERFGERPTARSLEIDLSDRGNISRALEAHWQGTPLEGLGKALLRLAKRFPRGEEKADVSSDVYEMF
ncbi:MAG: hypothetical protein JRG95_14730 [Deltaproteobacteria bacterium]|nr:hypothetical protein [Deltaproteobacteria bacterium]